MTRKFKSTKDDALNAKDSKWKSYGHFHDRNPGVSDPQAEPDSIDAARSPYTPVELPVTLLALMEQGLMQLSKRQRECMELFYGIGGKGRLPQSQIAREMKLTPSQVGTLVRNGLKHMREFLQERGYEG